MDAIDSTAKLAKHLGISRWSVSRVLNKKPGVSAATADKIRKAMTRYGFVPDPAARSLRGGKTATIGICLQELETLHLESKISAIQKRLKNEGYRGLVEFTLGEEMVEDDVMRHFASMRVEGVVVFASQLTTKSSGHRLIRTNGIPAVFVDPINRNLPGTVITDREYAMHLVVNHLCRYGHSRFAVFGVNPDMTYGGVRVEGLIEAVKSNKLPASSLNMISGKEPGVDYGCGWSMAKRYFGDDHVDTAIIALNDRVAVGAMAYMKEEGIDVPRQMSIVGYDNMDIAAYTSPPLTTVDAHVELLINDAVDKLMVQIRNGRAPGRTAHVIKPELVIRATTSVPGRK